MILYKTIERLIERRQTGGLSFKIDIFYAAGKITDKEYNDLSEMLSRVERE